MMKLDEKTIDAAVRAYENGSSLREIALSLSELGFSGRNGAPMSTGRLSSLLKLRGVKVLEKNQRRSNVIEKVLDMVSRGARQVDIAHEIGKSQATVSLIIKKLREDGRWMK